MVRADFDKKVPPSEIGIFNRQVKDPSRTEKTALWNGHKRYSMVLIFPNRNAIFYGACL